MIERLLESGDPEIRKCARHTLESAAAFRATRRLHSLLGYYGVMPSPTQERSRIVYDMNGATWPLPGKLVRSEGQDPSGNAAVDEAYDHSGITYDFYDQILNRNSLDNKGMTIVSSVNYGEEENNAYWDGHQMVYGNGDGKLFIRFTKSIEVVAHELTHGVVQFESNLVYENQPGALNEHFADSLGIVVEQWSKQLAVDDEAVDWWIGGEIMGPEAGIRGIRTFTGDKAYEDNEYFGTDPQPKHMDDLYTGAADYGGVHINSGIPNHAFYLIALEIGGNIWEKTGKLWYETLRSLNSQSQFADAAVMSHTLAGQMFGENSQEQKAVKNGWDKVGITL